MLVLYSIHLCLHKLTTWFLICFLLPPYVHILFCALFQQDNLTRFLNFGFSPEDPTWAPTSYPKPLPNQLQIRGNIQSIFQFEFQSIPWQNNRCFKHGWYRPQLVQFTHVYTCTILLHTISLKDEARFSLRFVRFCLVVNFSAIWLI